MEEKIYETRSEFYRLDRRVPLALYRPVEATERSEVAVLAMHGGDYLSFAPLPELAKRGYIAAGANPNNHEKPDTPSYAGLQNRLLDLKTAVEFMKCYPGVKKVILVGHSNGGCLTSCYQYIAENGTKRFDETKRIIPFPQIDPLTPADGLILLDANYGFMDVLAMDPAIKSLSNGFERIPELDVTNPENGYDPNGCHFTKDFILRFQKAQIKFYQDLLAYAQQRAEDISKGKGMFADDEPIVIPGAGTGSSANKLMSQDVGLLAHTRNPQPLLHKGGVITHEIVHTVRLPEEPRRSWNMNGGGSSITSVQSLLQGEHRFEDFGYDACSMWGADWNFNPYSTRANVQGIHVPLLVEGNTGSHEFINTEYNYENAVTKDKTAIFLEGASHIFKPVKKAEKHEGEFGDTLATLADFLAGWLGKPGRFMN
ncbi:MAG: alpha/beta hydrolase [Clostridiales bacterium]|nr:alpha/beta hydrolase [Clostridiales bacterium]